MAISPTQTHQIWFTKRMEFSGERECRFAVSTGYPAVGWFNPEILPELSRPQGPGSSGTCGDCPGTYVPGSIANVVMAAIVGPPRYTPRQNGASKWAWSYVILTGYSEQRGTALTAVRNG